MLLAMEMLEVRAAFRLPKLFGALGKDELGISSLWHLAMAGGPLGVLPEKGKHGAQTCRLGGAGSARAAANMLSPRVTSKHPSFLVTFVGVGLR